MKVYLVWQYAYDDMWENLVKIFDSEEKAKEYVSHRRPKDDWRYEEVEVK